MVVTQSLHLKRSVGVDADAPIDGASRSDGQLYMGGAPGSGQVVNIELEYIAAQYTVLATVCGVSGADEWQDSSASSLPAPVRFG